jgi:hypothetical protein
VFDELANKPSKLMELHANIFPNATNKNSCPSFADNSG